MHIASVWDEHRSPATGLSDAGPPRAARSRAPDARTEGKEDDDREPPAGGAEGTHCPGHTACRKSGDAKVLAAVTDRMGED